MPVRSTLPDVVIPDKDIFTYLLEEQKEYPEDKVIFEDSKTGRAYTYAQAREAASTFGHGLRAQWGWKKGDVMGILSPNNIDFPIVMLGTLFAGGIVSPINPLYTPKEIAFQLRSAGAKSLTTLLPLLPLAEEAARLAGIPKERIIVMGDDRHPTSEVKHFTSIRNLSSTARFPRVKINPSKDVAFLVFSSGTSGLPKCMMLSHRNIVAATAQGSNCEKQLTWNGNADGKGDRLLAVLPFFHIYGLTTLMLIPLITGLHVIVMARFELEDFLSNIQKHRITYIGVVPPILLALAKHPSVSKYDLSSLRMLNSGAAPLKAELAKEVAARTGVPVKQGYGLSETSPGVAVGQWANWEETIECSGNLLPNIECKIMSVPEEGSSESARELPWPGSPEQTGEIWLRGPNIFMGYLNNPKATAECLSPDGWFRTGDIGYLDGKKRLWVTDRLKELIKYKGFQVAPAELENIVSQHANVADVAVIGIPAEDGGEVPRAYVVAADKGKTTQADAEDIILWVAGRVAPHKKLRGGVSFIDAVPKTASGKVLRRDLKAQVLKTTPVKAKL